MVCKHGAITTILPFTVVGATRGKEVVPTVVIVSKRKIKLEFIIKHCHGMATTKQTGVRLKLTSKEVSDVFYL